MKLIKYKTPVMVPMGSLTNPNYSFVNTIEIGTQDDITSYQNLDVFGVKTGRDFMFVRDEMIALITTDGGFSTLSTEDQLIVARWSACAKNDALTLITADERKAYNMNTVAELKKSRSRRIELARQIIGNRILDGDMTYADSNDMLSSTEALFDNFVTGANPAFIYWLNSINGFELNGFASKSYYNEAVKNELIDIVVNGKII